MTTRVKTIAVAAVAALTMGAAMTTFSNEAEARYYRHGGAAVAAGIIGGIAAGAIIAGATRPAYAAPAYGYGYDYAPPSYGYAPAGGYNYSYGHGYGAYDTGYYRAPACYWTKQRVQIDPWTVQVRRVRVCN